MKSHDEAISAAYDALVETYSKILGQNWVNAFRPEMCFEITNDGENEIVRSTDGFVEIQVEETKIIGSRKAWKYNVYCVYNDDIGNIESSFEPVIASWQFISRHIERRLAHIHDLPTTLPSRKT
jgi:hypothetical protein